MTRINVVPVEELCDQHLLAEHRELTRIPNCIVRGRYSLVGQPSKYVLGKGHVKFFYDKLSYLHKRYNMLHEECFRRGFRPGWCWPLDVSNQFELWGDYTPTEEAKALNRERIADRMKNFEPRFSG